MPRPRSHETSGAPVPEEPRVEVEEKEGAQKIVIVETGDIADAKAHDAAEHAMTAEKDSLASPRLFRGEGRTSKEQLSGFGNIFKRIWKHNLFHEYYRQKELRGAREKIAEEGNVFALEEGTREQHDTEMQAIVERFSQEYEDEEVLRTGEKRETLAIAPETEGIRNSIRQLIRDYAGGTINKDAFFEERNRILSQVTGAKRGVVDNGKMYADNLFRVAEQVKASVAHGKGLDELDLDFEIVVGKAKESLQTEAHFNRVDRVVDKIQRSKIGRFMNETTIASAVAIASSLISATSQRFARSKALAWGTLGASAAVGAGVAGMRESKRIEEERSQHAREMAKNREYDAAKSPRRVEMEKYRYETKGATELAGVLEGSLYKPGTREAKKLTQAEFMSVLGHLADIDSRIKVSDRHDIDLIHYSDGRKIEQERTRLDVLRAQAKVDLRKLVESGEVVVPGGGAFGDFLKTLGETHADGLIRGDRGVEERNELFRKFKHKRVATAVVKGLVTGLAIGTVAQEVGSFFRSGQEGLVEGLVEGHEHVKSSANFTSLEGLRRWIQGDMPRMDSSALHEVVVGDMHYRLPEGADLVKNPDGTFNLLRGGDVVAENLGVDGQGHLSGSALRELGDKGVLSHESVQSVLGTKTVQYGAKEFLENHPELGGRVHRDLWYDNDTPKPVFDKNELKLWWGGAHNTGIDSNGNYVFNVKHMMPDGSYHEKFSADARELISGGKIKLLLSLSRDTQNQVFEVPVDIHGNAIVDPNSEMGRMFFENAGGRAKFLGQCAEVGEVMGAEDGAEHVRILATHVGEGVKDIADTVPVVEHIPANTLDVPADYFVEPPPFIPLFGRMPLEPTVPGREPIYYGYGDRLTPDKKKRYREQMSERLRNDPDARLEHHAEIDAYFKKQKPEYMKEVEALADSAEAMSPDCRLSICIPIAGHQEGENIYRTLENYLGQTAEKNSFELALFVNHSDRDLSGDKVAPDKTLEEIARFKKDHPEMNVRVMHRIFPREKAKMGFIRKMSSDSVLMRHHRRGEGSPDHILVSNDADNKGIAPEYIENFVKKFEEHPEADAMLGQLDWDPESYIRNPLIQIGTRIFQYIEVQSRHRGWHIGSSGANFAFRSGTYAAVDGYSAEIGGGEDVDLGDKIKLGRQGAKHHAPVQFAGARVSRLYTSSRRAEKSLKDGLSPIEQWDKGFGAFDDEVRKVKWEEKPGGINFEDNAEIERFLKELENVINRTIARTSQWGGSAYDPTLLRSLGWLGLKYDIVDKFAIRITDASRLVEGLKQYQKDGLEIWKRKAGESKT